MARINKKVIRLKLSDFIQSEIENKVIILLRTIQNYSKVQIILWYKDCELNKIDIEKFKNNYEDVFLKGNVEIINHNGDKDFIWYDIRNKKDCHTGENHKFKSYYSSVEDIVGCLTEVSNYVKFSINK